jgi:hypothetical protein
MKKKESIYVAGPMTGIKGWNKPAFNKASKFLAKAGYKPVNPAWLDHGKSGEKWETYLKRDIPHLLKCDGICVLPGWDRSRGAKLEVHIARALGILVYAIADKKKLVRVTMFPDNFIKFGPPIHETAGESGEAPVNPLDVPKYASMKEYLEAQEYPEVLTAMKAREAAPKVESVLQEAERLINGDRNASYGPPNQDFQRTADMWTGLWKYKLKDGEQLEPKDVAWAMVCLKASRAQHCNKKDNSVDAAGYASLAWRCVEGEGK